MRELTGVKAGVSKVVQGVPDRVLTVSGTLEGVAQAYGYIAQTLLDNPITPLSVMQQHQHQQSNATTVTTVRLLISHNLMGTVIGRQGAKIKHIQDTTGVRMMASKTLLSQSTERVVEVKGTVDAIHKAIAEIGYCLIEDKDRSYGTILYNPTKALIVANQTAAAATGSGGVAGGAGLGTSIGTSALPHHLSNNNSKSSHYHHHSHNNHHYHSHHQPQHSSNNYSYNANPAAAPVTAIPTLPPQALQQSPHITMNHSMMPGSTGVGYFSNNNNNNTSILPTATVPPQPYQQAPYPSFPQSPHQHNAFFTTTSANTPHNNHINTNPHNNHNGNSNSSNDINNDTNIRTQNISIPSDMVGCIIGKGGSKISEIRKLSGSRISIAKAPHDDTGERMFTIQGTTEANERALYLLYGQLEAEKERRLRGVQQQKREESSPAVEVQGQQEKDKDKEAAAAPSTTDHLG
ncbi:hypothetical protein BDF20DRAFT_869958 [Mycotypha africana]|uniref:uncharacterized protein n=1 Tax=Mycotypha africana TaxID=64632 RepID=UPI002301B6E4|nr:uncharacterized protein BDF20DRAFT_869958 [Mycotypha africana]KAI8979503.1 hypothetical protein BDF20DRAFT_869958 [Mycotypha africana]